MVADESSLEVSNANESQTAIRARGLSFTYRGSERPALEGLDLTVPEGSTTALVGASGAGKSTLCLTLNGLAPKFARGRLGGDLQVLGVKMGEVDVREMASLVGMVLQDFEVQLFSTSAELEVAFGLENLGVEPDRMKDIIITSLGRVGLSGFEKRDPSTLSGGEKQRLALASVLAMSPRLLVLDEPTSDLDPLGRREVMAMASGLAGGGRTVLLVEHETDELLKADQVVLLREGRLALAGPPHDVFGRKGLLESAGVRQPQLFELAEVLGLDRAPRTADEAEAAISGSGLSPDEGRCSALRDRRSVVSLPGPAGAGARERALPGGGKGLGAASPEDAVRQGTAILKAENVSYYYPGGRDGIRDISLEIKAGEFVAIVGVNGSGKTTLVKHFNGLLAPGEGAVEVDGMDTRRTPLSVIAGRVGFVFQNPDHQIFSESVADELAFGPKNAGIDSEEIARRSARALAAVRMGGLESADPFALTKGERQRVALASVLVMEPSVIVMDEPTTGLDFTQQRQVMGLLRDLNIAGHTILIVTHSLWLAAEYASRTIVLSEGRVAADGPTRRVMCEGEGLDRWSLVAPPVVGLARRLGVPALNALELAYCLGGDVEVSL